jgi:hypothetical protein
VAPGSRHQVEEPAPEPALPGPDGPGPRCCASGRIWSTDHEGFRRRLLLGEIANLGIIDLQPRTPALTEAARFAFPD